MCLFCSPNIEQLESMDEICCAGCEKLTCIRYLPHRLHALLLSDLPNLECILVPFEDILHLEIRRCPKLRGLPTLPSTLRILDCRDCIFTSLPTLPDNLFHLHCIGCKLLEYLPELPHSLMRLGVEDMPSLSVLPTLPEGLRILVCASTPIKEFPTLPNSLNYLRCENSLITSLNLPPNLETLACTLTPLKSLFIPDSVVSACCDGCNSLQSVTFSSTSRMNYLGVSICRSLTQLSPLPRRPIVIAGFGSPWISVNALFKKNLSALIVLQRFFRKKLFSRYIIKRHYLKMFPNEIRNLILGK